ncbi:superoxide dismutase [Ni] [Micromonospora haikouensis]|uniref:superoxide dismutase [Ni] n=1 Tax=Micromonospora haikouensis TaxID=686309 RepID=UPI003F4CDF56
MLWTDYFKPAHFEKYPNLHTLFNEAMAVDRSSATATASAGAGDAEAGDEGSSEVGSSEAGDGDDGAVAPRQWASRSSRRRVISESSRRSAGTVRSSSSSRSISATTGVAAPCGTSSARRCSASAAGVG